MVTSLVRYTFFTYCWVMVEPPCATVSLRRFVQSARLMPTGSMPSWRKKSLSSADSRACTKMAGIWS
jgi:hypothetical protein